MTTEQGATAPPDEPAVATSPTVEEEVLTSFTATVAEGAERLHRPWRALLTTGLFGGFEIGLGVLAYLLVLHETGSHWLAALAFGVGFVMLLLAHSELFTEDFLVPVMAVVAGRGSVRSLVRLWVFTLVTNLVGGWVVMALVATALPQFWDLLTTSAREFVDTPLGLTGAALALLGGAVITLLTRMHQGTDSEGAKIVACFAAALLLAGPPLFHSVLDSLIIFGAMVGPGTVDLAEWFGWFWWTALLNVVGGLALVTGPRLVRASSLPDGPGRR